MKRIISVLLAALMLATLVLPARAAESGIAMTDVTVGKSDMVYLTVSLQTEVIATAVSLEYEYIPELLEIVPGECQWKPEGVLADFAVDGNYAVWTTTDPVELSGDICVLAFQILDMEKFSETNVTCNVTVKKNSDVVGEFEASASIAKLPGDIDGNGSVTQEEAIYVLWHTLFPKEYPLETLVDLDDDGETTDNDAVILLWHALFPGYAQG